MLDHAKQVFAGTDITIGTEGERYLGAAIGNLSFKEEYVKKKIDKWVQDVARQFEYVKSQVNDDLKRCLELAREKGTGSWLTALPITSLGYVLNKQDFRDSLCLRYGWKIPNTPSICGCSKKNDVDHTLTCKTGGYVHMRHGSQSSEGHL